MANLVHDNFFEALPPKISDDKFDKWFHHPSIPAKCNEFGYIESTNPQLEFYDTMDPECFGIRVIAGSQKGKYRKTGFLFSCYHGIARAPRTIFYLDGNPYNTTKSNLIAVNYSPPDLLLQAFQNTYAFIENTIKQIPVVCRKYAKFWTWTETVQNLNIPQTYLEFYSHPKKFKLLRQEHELQVKNSISKKKFENSQKRLIARDI